METIHLLAAQINIPPDERHGSRVMLKSTIKWLITTIIATSKSLAQTPGPDLAYKLYVLLQAHSAL